MLKKIVFGILAAAILLAGCIATIPGEKGTLELTSSPTGAEIYLDNQYRGTTPSTIAGVEPGTHTLEYRMNGYSSWSSAITVPSGTSNYFAALEAVTVTPTPVGTVTPIEVSLMPSMLTLDVSRDVMIIGDSIIFSGTCNGCRSIILTLYGPGAYKDGVVLTTVQTGALNSWSYTWNPGTKPQSGTYTIMAKDSAGAATARKDFKAIGNGMVTVIPSRYAVATGDTVTFSGQCTTGAGSVRLVLLGPDRLATGLELGTISVTADNRWSYQYRVESGLPTGTYTIYVSDVPKTTSASNQFTVGYTS